MLIFYVKCKKTGSKLVESACYLPSIINDPNSWFPCEQNWREQFTPVLIYFFLWSNEMRNNCRTKLLSTITKARLAQLGES
jgi:hypothetical protein